MREITSKVYQFDELSDRAKERARDWWRECESQDFGGFGELSEPYETAAKLLGIEFATRAVKLMGGGTRYEPRVYWSGFSSQGDGASFEGSYSYRKGCRRLVRKEFPTDKQLHQIADTLTQVQRKHGYRLTASISQSGNYVHEYTMSVSVTIDTVMQREADAETEETILEAMRDFARWIYKGIEAEYEYRMSEENVDESIRVNEYEFTEDGEIA